MYHHLLVRTILIMIGKMQFVHFLLFYLPFIIKYVRIPRQKSLDFLLELTPNICSLMSFLPNTISYCLITHNFLILLCMYVVILSLLFFIIVVSFYYYIPIPSL